MHVPGGRKDPFTALFLSLLVPGAGYAYAGEPRRFVTTFLTVAVLYYIGSSGGIGLIPAILAHVFTSIGAAGATRTWNERNAAALPPGPAPVVRAHTADGDGDATFLGDVPPPPPRRTPTAATSQPPPPPVPAGSLTPDEFLAELRDAWQERREGRSTDAAFAERKRTAIERVHADDWDDGVALLEATTSLVGAGVLTPAERGRLKLRVGRG